MFSIGQNRHSFLKGYRAGEYFPVSRVEKLWSGRPVEYRVMDTTVLVSIPYKDFKERAQLPGNLPKVMDYMQSVISMQLSRIDNLTHHLARQKLLERLDYFARRFGNQVGESVVIDVPVSQAEIASSIGARRETVNRLMTELQQKGIITTKRETVIVNSMSDLQKLIDGE